MVAYNFRPRFSAPIVSGAKRQTIRADRKRHARPGEPLQLYTGMRTKGCRLIGLAECLRVYRIEIKLHPAAVNVDGILQAQTSPSELDGFANLDGFADWADFAAFFKAAHGATTFEGVLIRWCRFEAAP